MKRRNSMEKVQLPEADLRGIEFELQNIQIKINLVNSNLSRVDNFFEVVSMIS